MPNLEIITIGTELLLGEITDTNSTYIARTLRDHGIDIFRITTIGDNPSRIAGAIKEALGRADIVITTGGLGPTVDDPTRQAAALATDRELVFQPELWDNIVTQFEKYGRKPTENNRRQAFIPQYSIPVKNPVGTAPCFIIEVGNACVISLPGVPREMEFILRDSIIPFLNQKFVLKTQIIKATVLHSASIGESVIDEMIEDLEQMSNPTVGLLAHPGQVDIRVTSKASSEQEALLLSKPVVEEIKLRLGENIYGQDGETLEFVISQLFNENQMQLGIVEFGIEGSLEKRLNSENFHDLFSTNLKNEPVDFDDFEKSITQIQQIKACDIWLGLAVKKSDPGTAYLYYQNHNSQYKNTMLKSYGGPKEYIPLWAQNISLDFLRRHLIKSFEQKKKGAS